jgi:uncharacterized membrane protein YkoI
MSTSSDSSVASAATQEGETFSANSQSGKLAVSDRAQGVAENHRARMMATRASLNPREQMLLSAARLSQIDLPITDVTDATDAAETADEEAVAIDALPQIVVDAVNQALPNSTIVEAEAETEGGQIVYEVEVLVDGQEFEVKVSEDGTVLEVEEED